MKHACLLDQARLRISSKQVFDRRFYIIATRKLKFQIKMSINPLDAFMFGIGCPKKQDSSGNAFVC